MTAALPEPTEPAEPTEDPGLALLSGDGAGELMSAVLAAVGGRLLRWRTSQVDHQPGVRTTVSYSARVRWSDGTTGVETLGATDGRLPGGVARLSDGEIEIGMWRFPFDPDLPALPAACDAARMQRLANSVGLEGPVRLRVRTYRPRRRAVIELIAGGGPRLRQGAPTREGAAAAPAPPHRGRQGLPGAGLAGLDRRRPARPRRYAGTDAARGARRSGGARARRRGDPRPARLAAPRAGSRVAAQDERLDDAACLLGHLGVLAQLQPSRAGLIGRFALRVQRRFERDLEPAALRRRTAAVVLSLATGPHRVQERDWRANTECRLALAERWLQHAGSPRSVRG